MANKITVKAKADMLTAFLTKEGALANFRRNLMTNFGISIEGHIAKMEADSSVIAYSDAVICAFAWQLTPEKNEYWSDINRKWLEYLKQINF